MFSLVAAFNAANPTFASEVNTLKNVSFSKISDNNVEIKIETENGLKEVPKIFEKDKNSYFIALDSTFYKGKKNLNIDNIKESIVSASVEYIPYKSKPNEGYTKISIVTTDETLLNVAKLPFNPENRKFKKLIRLLTVLLGSCVIVGSGIVLSLTFQNKKRISGLSELDKTEESNMNETNQTQILNINPEALDYNDDSVDLANFKNNFIVNQEEKEEEFQDNPQEKEEELYNETENVNEENNESSYQEEDFENKNNAIGENNMYPSPDDIVNDVLSSEEAVTELSKVVLNEIEEQAKDYTVIQTEEEIDEVFDDLDKEEPVNSDDENEIIQDEEGLNNFFNEDEFAEVNDVLSNQEISEEVYEEEVYETEKSAEVVEADYQTEENNEYETYVVEQEEVQEYAEEAESSDEETLVYEDAETVEDNSDKTGENNIDFKSVQYTPSSGISMFTPKTLVFSTAPNPVEEVVEETYEEEVYETEETIEETEEVVEETYEEEVYEIEEPAEETEEVVEEIYEEEVYETEEPAEETEEVVEETYEEEVYETEETIEETEEVVEETYEEEVYEIEEPAEETEEVVEETYEEEVYEIEELAEETEEVVDETYEEEVYETEELAEVLEEGYEDDEVVLEDIFDEIETTDEDLEIIEDIVEDVPEENIENKTFVIEENAETVNLIRENFVLSQEIPVEDIQEAKDTFDELAVIMNDEIVPDEQIVDGLALGDETLVEEEIKQNTVTENIIDTLFQGEIEEDNKEENIFSEFNIGGFDAIVAETPTQEEIVLNSGYTYQEESVEEVIENEITTEETVSEIVEELETYASNEIIETTPIFEDEENIDEVLSEEEESANSEFIEIQQAQPQQEEIIISENIEREEDMMLEETPISTEKFFVENDEEENDSSDLFKNEYAYNSSDVDNTDNDDIFFDDEDMTEDLDDSEPIVVSEKEIENNKQLYLIRHEGKYSLIGTMENEVFVIHKFDEKPSKTRINTKLNETKPNQHIYIVKIDTWRALISITDKTMENLLTLS